MHVLLSSEVDLLDLLHTVACREAVVSSASVKECVVTSR